MGPPPAAALTLTTGLPGDSPAFPVRRTLRGFPVPRTTTEPQRKPGHWHTPTAPGRGPLARGRGSCPWPVPAETGPLPGSKWPHGPRPQSRMPLKVFESAGPLGCQWRMCHNISQYRRAFSSPQQGPSDELAMDSGGAMRRDPRTFCNLHTRPSARPTQQERFVSAEVG